MVFGYNGVVPQTQNLIPIRVQMRNEWQNLSGEILLTQPAAGAEVTLRQRFRCPSPSSRQYMLLPRLEAAGGLNGRSIRVDVVFDQKDVQTISKTYSAGNKTGLDVVLGIGLSANFFKMQDGDRKADYRTSFSHRYQLVDFPRKQCFDDMLAYDSVYAIIITAKELERLSARNMKALYQWVALGGRLMIRDEGQGGEAATKFVANLGAGRSGLFSTGGGLVLVHKVRPKQLPFWQYPENFDAAKVVFPNLMKVDHMGSGLMGSVSRDSVGILNRLTARQESSTYGVKGLFWLILIIAAYCCFIGPLDWLIVRKTKRTWITWPLFLIAVGGFSFLAHWYSGVVHSLQMTTLQLNVVDVSNDVKIQRGTTMFWVYSTGNFEFEITSDMPDMHFSCRESGGTFQTSMAETMIEHGKTPRIETRLPIHSSKTYGATWTEQSTLQVTELPGEEAAFQLSAAFPKVGRAMLATRDGVYPLNVDGDNKTLVLSGQRYDWAGFRHLVSSISKNPRTQLPSETGMQNYLLAISFPGTSEFYRDQNERERALQLSSVLSAGGRVLLIIPEKRNMNPLNFDKLIPNRIQADLIRVYLPPK